MLPLSSSSTFPQWPFEVRQDGIGEGIAATLIPAVGYGDRNLVEGGTTITNTAVPVDTFGKYGAQYNPALSASYLTLDTPMPIAKGYSFRIIMSGPPTGYVSVASMSSSSFNYYLLRVTNNNTLAVYDTGFKAFFPNFWPTPTPANPSDVIITYDGTTAVAYENGVWKGDIAASLNTSLSMGSLLNQPGQTRGWSDTPLMQAWNRPLDAGEVAEISGPNKGTSALFRGLGKSYFIPSAGGADVSGSGSLLSGTSSTSSSGDVLVDGTGGMLSALASMAGVGTVTSNTVTGSGTLTSLTASLTNLGGPIASGSGTPSSLAATMAAAGSPVLNISVGLQVADAVISGDTVLVKVATTAAMQAELASASGVMEVTVEGNGTMVSGAARVVGREGLQTLWLAIRAIPRTLIDTKRSPRNIHTPLDSN